MIAINLDQFHVKLQIYFRETEFYHFTFPFFQVLKSCDAHSNEYVDRLKDEERVMQILEKAQKLLEKAMTPSEICRIYLQRVDHIYFKFDPNVIKQKNVSLSNFFKFSQSHFFMMINYVLQFRALAMKSTDILKFVL